MNFSQTLEVAVGLIIIYYILGSIVSTITRLVTDTLETRGIALQEYLRKALGERAVDLNALPQIQALRPIRYKKLLSIFKSEIEAKRVEKIPAPVLVDAFFDLSGLSGKSGLDASQLTELINQLPASEGRDAILHWINQGVTDLNDLRTRVTTYLTGILDQASAAFAARARSIVMLLSVSITLLFGTDSIQLARDLWDNAELRAVASAKADMIVEQQGSQADLQTLVDDLKLFSINLGWWQNQDLPDAGNPGQLAGFLFLKLAGLSLTAAAVSQGSSFWYDLLKKIVAPSSREHETQS